MGEANNELRMFKLGDNFKRAKLLKVPAKGTAPSPRFGHTMKYIESKTIKAKWAIHR